MLKAIETTYRGYRFRSRLEARWAIFADTLGLQWTYEPEGFELYDGSRYLPDFLVDGIGWIEIKPDKNAEYDDEVSMLGEVVYGTVKNGYLLAGSIPDPECSYLETGDSLGLEVVALFPGHEQEGSWYEDYGYWFCVCPVCGKVGIEYQARGARVCGGKEHVELAGKDREFTGNHPQIIEAISAARGARFEHGENSEVIHATS